VIYVVYAVHVLVCLFLILVVLLQQGKGADLSVFGGGSTQTAFGAVGATSLLHKLTVTSFVLFILTTMTIAVNQTGSKSSVMKGVETQAPAEGAATPAEPTPAEATPADSGANAAPAAAEGAPSTPEATATPEAEPGGSSTPPDGGQSQ